MNRNLLTEAIADAKVVKESAIANAKKALEEALTPHLKSMLASKLEEMENDEELPEDLDLSGIEEEDLDLESILREVEESESESDEPETKEDEPETKEDESEESEPEEDESDFNIEDMTDEDLKKFIEEVIAEMVKAGELETTESEEETPIEDDEEELPFDIEDDEEELPFDIEDDEEPLITERKRSNFNKNMNRTKLNEALSTVKQLQTKLNSVNLLNAKLLYVNKLFKAKSLNESQKLKVLSALDKAKSTKEAKLIYETLNENIQKPKPIKNNIMGSASKTLKTINESKKPIIESSEMVKRFQKLAGI